MKFGKCATQNKKGGLHRPLDTTLFSATLFTFIISRIGDSYKHKRFLLAGGCLVRSLCWFLMGLITSFEQLVVIQFVLGLGEALGTPAFDAIFAEHLDKGHHVMDYSDWKVVANAVLVLGTLAGGVLVTKFGFQPLLFLMSGLAMLSFVGIVGNKRLDSKVA